MDSKEINAIQEMIESKHWDFESVKLYAENHHLDLADFEDWESSFQDAYMGEYDNELDYAYHLIDDLGYIDELPEHLAPYFDYEKFARDLFISGDYWIASNGAVFRSY